MFSGIETLSSMNFLGYRYLKQRRTVSLGSQRSLATRTPFQTLNGELLHLSHLRCLIVVEQAPFLTGSSRGPALNAKSLILPKLSVLLLQIAGFDTDIKKKTRKRNY